MVKVAVDTMTTELGPAVAVLGAIDAVKEIEQTTDDLEVILVGDMAVVNDIVDSSGYNGDNITIVNSDGIISMDNGSMRSWISETTKETSLRKCADLVALSRQADGFLSAGNSAASGIVAKKSFGLVNGVRTTPIVCQVPTDNPDHYCLMGDVGIQVDYTDQSLVECAVMQAAYIGAHYDLPHQITPRIGILNIGEEKHKGNTHMKKAFKQLEKIAETGLFNFVGNKEPKHMISGDVDGVVCGADLGNMYIKAGAAVAKMLMRDLKDCSWLEMPLFALAIPYLTVYKYGRGKRFNPSTYCGAPILGTKEVGVITHGRSDREAMKQATLRTREHFLLHYSCALETCLAKYRPFDNLK